MTRSIRFSLRPLLLCFFFALTFSIPVWSDVSQFENLGDLKQRLRRYQDSGEYAADIAAVAAKAKDYLAGRAGSATKPAIVLDIDETALSNWPLLKANDLGLVFAGSCDLDHGPCGFLSWAEMARSAAIGPTLELYRLARELHVAVFFITGRPESLRAATERNLREVGYADWDGLYLKPPGLKVSGAAQYKAPIRCDLVAQGYVILVNIGDQPSDLDGGCAEQAFQLPNPFYRIP